MNTSIRKKVVTFVATILLIFGICINSYAVEIREADYSAAYLDWLELDDEQKQNSIMPRKYKIIINEDTPINPIKSANLLGASLESRFNLNSYIGENMTIRDQGKFGACWAFASTASLESNLALRDYQNKRAKKVYDFSEMHMIYATSTSFLNNERPSIKFNRKASKGGSAKIAEAYFTNGTGPIEEKYMPYDDTAGDINIEEIRNKVISAEITDIADFPATDSIGKENLKALMKNHIKNNGGIICSTHESDEPGGSTASGECPNPKTGATYCSNSSTHITNHAVVIVGWDDNYAIENFKEGYRPSNKGAWIAKDSHGDDASRTETFDEYKKLNFEQYKDEYLQQGVTNYTQIPDEFIANAFENKEGYIVDINKKTVRILHNDNGYVYISYDDANVYNNLMGIVNTNTSISYENVYQHNPQGTVNALTLNTNQIYFSNIFDKKTTSNEYITKVALNTPETVSCKVYINPKNANKDKNSLQLVQLKSGEMQTIDPGYHTLEFASPVQITGDKFVVVIEIQGKQSNQVGVSILFNQYEWYKNEYKREPEENLTLVTYKDVEIKTGNCFMATREEFNNNQWTDLGILGEAGLVNSASSLKAFTVSKTESKTLNNIAITTPPTKTKYTEGENFDKTGMVVTAYYSDGTNSVITDYEISNGSNLKKDQTFVTIKYKDKEANQNITVESKATPTPTTTITPSPTTTVTPTPTTTVTPSPTTTITPTPTTTVTPSPTPSNPPIEDEKPKNTNFSSANCVLTSMKYYKFSDATKEEYIIMQTTIDTIDRVTGNDELEYYYYLSENPNESDITDWIKIDEKQQANNKLLFTVNTKDVKNILKLKEKEKIYIYIREIAKKGGNQSVTYSKGLDMVYDENKVNLEIYLDNKKVEEPEKPTDPDVPTQDPTVSKENLPNTGIKKVILFIMIGVIIFGIYEYIRYRILKKYIK